MVIVEYDDEYHWHSDHKHLPYWTDAIEDYWGAIPSEDSTIFLAMEDERSVGYISGYGCDCYYLGVDPEFRRRGIGTKLVNHSGMFYPVSIAETEVARAFWDSISQCLH